MNYWKKWAKAAGIRAIKAIAQTFLVEFSALLAGLVSMLTSVAGLPELSGDEDEEEEKEE